MNYNKTIIFYTLDYIVNNEIGGSPQNSFKFLLKLFIHYYFIFLHNSDLNTTWLQFDKNLKNTGNGKLKFIFYNIQNTLAFGPGIIFFTTLQIKTKILTHKYEYLK